MIHEAIRYLAIAQLVVLPQVRKRVSREVVEGMAKTIRRLGRLLLPLRVRPLGDKYAVVDGHIRFMGGKSAGLAYFPCIIEERELTDAEVAEFQLIANRRRAELRPIEFAEAIAELMHATQCTLSELAERLGESVPTLSRSLPLLTLPDAIKAKVESGEISASAAYKLTQIKDAKQQEELAAELASGQLTRDGLNGKLKADRKPNRKRSTNSRKERLTTNLSDGVSLVICRNEITLEEIANVLTQAADRARAASSRGAVVKDFLRSLQGGISGNQRT